MRLISFGSASLALLAIVPFTAACSGDLLDSSGQNGKVTFAYESSQCLLGCRLEHPVAEGALIRVATSGDALGAGDTARLEPASLGNVTYSTSCTCRKSDGSSASAGASGQCGSGEARSCTGNADIRTDSSGSAKLSIYDARGQLVDAVSFGIKRADQVTSTVNVNDAKADVAADGAYVAHVHDKIEVHSTVTANGEPLIFTENGLAPHYSNEAVVGPDDGAIFGATDTEYGVANSAGSAQLTMVARGAQSVTTFRIAP